MAYADRRPDRDGFWLFYKDRNGRHARKKSAFTKKELADREARDLENAEQSIAKGFGRPDIDLSEVVARYLADAALRMRPISVRQYTWDLGQIVAWLNVVKVSQVSPSDVMAYREQRKADDISNLSVNRTVSALKSCLTWAVKDARLIERNPLGELRPLPKEESKRRAMTPEEITALLGASPNPWKDIWTFFINTGLRRGEFITLTWTQIDFKKRTLTIPAAKSKNKTTGIVRLNSVAIDILKKQRFTGPGGYVFTNPHTGGKYARGTLNDAMKVHLEAAKIDATGLCVHALRHTAASLMLSAGASVKGVQALLRHKKLDMTLNVYAKAYESDERAAAESICPLFVPKPIEAQSESVEVQA